MAVDEAVDPGITHVLTGLRALQAEFGVPVADVEHESPRAALSSLEDAIAKAPAAYRSYLEEAVRCYENNLYRASILMVWLVVMQHLYSVAAGHRGGVAAFETANAAKFGKTRFYREIKKMDDFLYLGDANLLVTWRGRGPLQQERPRDSSRNASTYEIFAVIRPSTSQVARRPSSSSRASCSDVLSGGQLNW